MLSLSQSICLLLFAGLVFCGPLTVPGTPPRADPERAKSFNGTEDATPEFSCDLSNDCGHHIEMPKLCDRVINENIWRSDRFHYTVGKKVWPESERANEPCVDAEDRPGHPSLAGCQMWLEGPEHCKRTGNQVWWDWQDIHHYGCTICGKKTWGKRGECTTVVDGDPACMRGWGEKQGPLPDVWPPCGGEPLPLPEPEPKPEPEPEPEESTTAVAAKETL